MSKASSPSNSIAGNFYRAGDSQAIAAYAMEVDDACISIHAADTGTLILQAYENTDYAFSDNIPGVAVEILFHNGELFQPHDRAFRWSGLTSKRQRMPAQLESRWSMAILAAILIPLLILWIVLKGAPMSADAIAVRIPESVVEKSSLHTLRIIDRLYFEASEVPLQRQDELRAIWRTLLDELALSAESFQLLFRQSTIFGANAFALPNGTVIITDDLIHLLENQNDALMAILLHEIGHVHHQHGMKLISRSAVTGLLFSLVLGDIDGMGEIIIGGSASLLDSSFSREMESEADAFAFEKLQQLGKSPSVFADAMEALQAEHGEDHEKTQSIERYFSTHPMTQDRIEKARNYQHE